MRGYARRLGGARALGLASASVAACSGGGWRGPWVRGGRRSRSSRIGNSWSVTAGGGSGSTRGCSKTISVTDPNRDLASSRLSTISDVEV